jgi:putative SOS response-associated peptidase YedK
MSVLVEQFRVSTERQLALRFNIAPTQMVAAVRAQGPDKSRELALLKWGLVPSWATDPAMGSRLINARAESVADKPSFRSAFKRRRCLILADGYYEWKAIGKAKQPYLIHRRDDQPFAFAGLWEFWRPDPNAESLESCTIITTSASPAIQKVHDRMPVILHRCDYDAWLDPGKEERATLEPLLVPYEGDEFIAEQVTTHVNNARNDDERCVERLDTSSIV